MSTIYLLIGAAFVLLLILGATPGVKYLIQPVIGGISLVFTVFFGHLTMWLVWLVKTIYLAHMGYVVHLFSRRSKIDPTEDLGKK